MYFDGTGGGGGEVSGWAEKKQVKATIRNCEGYSLRKKESQR